MKQLLNALLAKETFFMAIKEYHVENSVETAIRNPFESNSFKNVLYKKNWIDTVQWHLEDIIRDPSISKDRFIEIKRQIDKSNQFRTDTVEELDALFFTEFSKVEKEKGARLNSETPAWLLDRLSILELKIFHFKEQVNRIDADSDHLKKANIKLNVLLEQEQDLSECFDELMDDLASGRKIMKTYKQMKMYNDPSLNPELYGKST